MLDRADTLEGGWVESTAAVIAGWAAGAMMEDSDGAPNAAATLADLGVVALGTEGRHELADGEVRTLAVVAEDFGGKGATVERRAAGTDIGQKRFAVSMGTGEPVDVACRGCRDKRAAASEGCKVRTDQA